MKRSVSYLAVTLLCSIFVMTGSVYAQVINIDLGKIDPELAVKILEWQQKKDGPKITVSQTKEWAEIGENVAKAIAATAKALSIEVNEFVKTPVGKWAFFFIFWHILGAKIWAIVGGIGIWTTLGIMIWKSFRAFHIPQKLLVEKDGKKEYQYKKYEFRSDDARVVSVGFHVGLFVALSIAMALVILY